MFNRALFRRLIKKIQRGDELSSSLVSLNRRREEFEVSELTSTSIRALIGSGPGWFEFKFISSSVPLGPTCPVHSIFGSGRGVVRVQSGLSETHILRVFWRAGVRVGVEYIIFLVLHAGGGPVEYIESSGRHHAIFW